MAWSKTQTAPATLIRLYGRVETVPAAVSVFMAINPGGIIPIGGDS